MADFTVAEPHGDTCRVIVAGEVDIACTEELLAAGRSALATSSGVVELDLGGVSFIDSSGLGSLVLLRNEAAAQGSTIRLVNVPAPVRRLLDVTGLTGPLDVRAED